MKEKENRECEQALQSALDAWKQCSIDQFKKQVLAIKVISLSLSDSHSHLRCFFF